MIAVAFGEIFEAIRQIFFGLFHQEFFLGVASTLGAGVFNFEFVTNLIAELIQSIFDGALRGKTRNSSLQAARSGNRKTNRATTRIFFNNYLTKFRVI